MTGHPHRRLVCPHTSVVSKRSLFHRFVLFAVIERRGSHSSSDDAALGPHRGRFKMGQDSSDTDSSDVDSIVVKRDVKRKLKGYSDSEGSGSDDERKPLVRQASTPLAASKPAVTVPADALATTATAATVSKSSKRGSMPLTAGGIQHFNSDEESKFGQEGRVIIRLTETGKSKK